VEREKTQAAQSIFRTSQWRGMVFVENAKGGGDEEREGVRRESKTFRLQQF